MSSALHPTPRPLLLRLSCSWPSVELSGSTILWSSTSTGLLHTQTRGRFKEVTLRQLLSHGAGIVRDGLDADYWQLGRQFPNTKQLIKEILEAQLVTDPNAAMKYSNFGYGLLGMVIEERSGTSYADYVSEHICAPLGLTSTAAELTFDLAARVRDRIHPA